MLAAACTKYIFAGSQRTAQVRTLGADDDTYYYHTDHLQSASIMTAGSDVEGNLPGDKVEDLYYYPYGEVLSDFGSISVKHKFAGHEYDAETGLIYMGARYYDPRLARFITADPVVPARVDQHNFLSFKVKEDLNNPQKLNRYSYCGNNPVVLRDPFGLDWTFVDTVSTGLGIASAVAGTVALANPSAKPMAAGLSGLSAGFSYVANKAGYMSDSEAGRNIALAGADLAGAGLEARGYINIGNLFSIIARGLGIANTGYDAAKAAGSDPGLQQSEFSSQTQPQSSQTQRQQSHNQDLMNNQVQLPSSQPKPPTQTMPPLTAPRGPQNADAGKTSSVQQPSSQQSAPKGQCPGVTSNQGGNSNSTGNGSSGVTVPLTQTPPGC